MTVFQKIKHYGWIFIQYFSLIFFSFIALLPVVSCLITAFKTKEEYESTSVMTLPESWLNFSNFIQVWEDAAQLRRFPVLHHAPGCQAPGQAVRCFRQSNLRYGCG